MTESRPDPLYSLAVDGAAMAHLNRWGVLSHHDNGSFRDCTDDRCVRNRATLAEARSSHSDVSEWTAIDQVLAYGAEPPEYPGLVLVPREAMDALREHREANR